MLAATGDRGPHPRMHSEEGFDGDHAVARMMMIRQVRIQL